MLTTRSRPSSHNWAWSNTGCPFVCHCRYSRIIEGHTKAVVWDTALLRHIERNATLLFMIPCITEDIKKEYDILLNELQTIQS
ncbi:MAG: hypothetical protein R2788_00350 [Saprospiraceae bacterium]